MGRVSHDRWAESVTNRQSTIDTIVGTVVRTFYRVTLSTITLPT